MAGELLQITLNSEIQKKILREFWTDALADYKPQYAELYKELKDEDATKDMYHEDMPWTPEVISDATKVEGGTVPLFGMKLGNKKRWTHKMYGAGFIYTFEFEHFNKYDLVKKLLNHLSTLAKEDPDIQIASLVNDANNSTNTGFDGLPLLSTQHTLLGSTETVANRPATYVDLSVSAVEEGIAYFRKYKTESGRIRPKEPALLVVHPDNEATGFKIINSTNVPFEMSNTINYERIRKLKLFVYVYQTDTDQWMLFGNKNDEDFGLFYAFTKKPDIEATPQVDGTRNVLVSSIWGYKFGIGNSRMVYGSMGA